MVDRGVDDFGTESPGKVLPDYKVRQAAIENRNARVGASREGGGRRDNLDVRR